MNSPRPLLTADPREGTVGPLVSTVIVIGILLLGAWLALQGIIDRVQSRRALAEYASSTLPDNVQAQSVTVE